MKLKNMFKKVTTVKTADKSKVQVLDKNNLEKLSGGVTIIDPLTCSREKLKATT